MSRKGKEKKIERGTVPRKGKGKKNGKSNMPKKGKEKKNFGKSAHEHFHLLSSLIFSIQFSLHFRKKTFW